MRVLSPNLQPRTSNPPLVCGVAYTVRSGRTYCGGGMAGDDDLDLGRLEPGSGTPLYRQIADRVAARITSGRLPPGARLPTVRGLAKTLGVGVITVAQAYEALREANLVSGQVGRGTFVRDRTARETPAHASYLPS